MSYQRQIVFLKGLQSNRAFLFGDHLSDTDIRLFVTLIGFYTAHHGLSKCNPRWIANYLNLTAHLERMLAPGGIPRTVIIGHIERGCYFSSV